MQWSAVDPLVARATGPDPSFRKELSPFIQHQKIYAWRNLEWNTPQFYKLIFYKVKSLISTSFKALVNKLFYNFFFIKKT